MAKEIKLVLINDKGQKDTFIQERIPMQKLIDALELQDQFENKKITSLVEGVKKKIEFVSGCFDDDRVTPEAILKGLDVTDFEEKIDGVINHVLGIDPETKKSQTEKP